VLNQGVFDLVDTHRGNLVAAGDRGPCGTSVQLDKNFRKTNQ
jgi:hypothetical protein